MDTGFFILSKLVGALIRAETWIILLLVLGTWARWRGRLRLARTGVGLGLTFLLLLTLLPLGDVLIRPLEARFPVAPDLVAVDGIIVLGGAEQAGRAQQWGLPQTNDAGERFIEGAALALAHPQAKLLFTGGSGALGDLGNTDVPQAAMAHQLFTRLGIAPERILLERTSRNTAENARNSLALIQPELAEVWVLVTSAYHMPRAVQSFQAAGWPQVVPWPVDHRSGSFVGGLGWNLSRNLNLFNKATKETIGLIAYNLTGR
ncbi:YdcF family protein [Thalassovita sp.]|uniref:YdcF family protein n=1 Tax=Thalassovita sp. TaxID=1979401 RepID=UPI002881533E|nr:YdcF family protein [Thalassovita sp.]MDF1802060.1 YdcF family protein [Thalassovita sp.]